MIFFILRTKHRQKYDIRFSSSICFNKNVPNLVQTTRFWNNLQPSTVKANIFENQRDFWKVVKGGVREVLQVNLVNWVASSVALSCDTVVLVVLRGGKDNIGYQFIT